ncbi:MAG: HEAT repeat domain-containing protein, partial [Planctomycetes bacterium]|nr:HEAT repeat domain-containing protein [Planctomycetota bacterium]
KPVLRAGAAAASGHLCLAEMVDALIGLLETEEEASVCAAVVAALGRIGDERAIPALVLALKSPEASVRCAAVFAYAKISAAEATPALITALNDVAADVSSMAVRALADIGGPDATDALAEVLRASVERHDCRGDVAAALADLRSEKAVPILLAMLDEEGGQVNAAEALGRIGDCRALPSLAALIEDEAAPAYSTAVDALGRIGTPEAVDALAAALMNVDGIEESERDRSSFGAGVTEEEPSVNGIEDSEYERVLIIDALGSIQSDAAAKALLAVIDKNDQNGPIEPRVIEALARTRQARAVTPIVRNLPDDFSNVNLTAIDTLLRLHRASAVKQLTASLQDPQPHVRARCATMLGRLGDSQVAPTLRRMLTDWDATDAARYMTSTESAIPESLFCVGWRPNSMRDVVHLLIAERQRTLLLALWPAAKETMFQDVESSDRTVARNAVCALIGLGRPESVRDLLAILSSRGTVAMAELYLNSGHKPLEDAARRWAAARGFVVESKQGCPIVGWGCM